MAERKDMLRKLLIVALALGSLFFIARIFMQSPVSWQTVWELTSPGLLIAALAPCVLMLVSKAILHAMIVEDVHGSSVAWSRIISSYAQAQLIRYVPGKVWGIIYQGEQLSSLVSRKTVWTANIVQMFLTNLNSIGVVLGFACILYLNGLLAALAFVVFLGACVWVSGSGIMSKLARLLTPKSSALSIAESLKPPAPRRIAGETSILQVEWIFYYAAWLLLLDNLASVHEVLIISTSYAAASFVGMLVIVMPSGWLVREAMFIWLGDIQGLGADELLVLSVVMRLFFIVGDFLCAVLLFLWSLAVKHR